MSIQWKQKIFYFNVTFLKLEQEQLQLFYRIKMQNTLNTFTNGRSHA